MSERYSKGDWVYAIEGAGIGREHLGVPARVFKIEINDEDHSQVLWVHFMCCGDTALFSNEVRRFIPNTNSFWRGGKDSYGPITKR
jgi:hypothetical protein